MRRSPFRLLPLALAALAVGACGESKKSPPPPVAAPSGAPAQEVDAVSEAAASYRVVAAVAPESVPKGRKAALTLAIEMTRPDVHVQAEFPLKVALTTTDGLAVEKHGLGHADARDPAAKDRRWEVPLEARAAGPQRVDAALRFALCKETEPLWCVTRNETVSASLVVR